MEVVEVEGWRRTSSGKRRERKRVIDREMYDIMPGRC